MVVPGSGSQCRAALNQCGTLRLNRAMGWAPGGFWSPGPLEGPAASQGATELGSAETGERPEPGVPRVRT